MSRYLKGYTLTERWEAFKKMGVNTVYPLISALEELSVDPSKVNVDIVRQIEKDLQEEILELNKNDREVLEDMIVRILYQATNKLMDDYTRWDFTLSRARDKGIYDWFEEINNKVMKSEELMSDYKSSGDSNEAYVEKQEDLLASIDNVWDDLFTHIQENGMMSDYYVEFFKKQLDRKRVVIQRHIENYGDDIFGEWLKSIRIKKGWSLARAGEETGASPSYIHRIERGVRSVPSVTKLEQLSEGYGVPYNKMIAMASGGVESLDDYLKNGAFTINGQVATNEEMEQLSELASLILEDDLSGAQDQLQFIHETLHK